MELFRKSLKLTVVKGLDESQGSANVPVTLTHDSNDEYADYTEQIHMRYMSNNQIYEEILPYSNNEYTIHSKALANIGTLELAVHLIKGTTELVTNQITFEIKEAPNAVSMVDPSEHNWQQLVDQYMESKLNNYTTEKKVREILDAMYPVGSVYITADKNNPGNFIGGTWEQFGQGRTLIGEGTGDDGSTSMSFTPNSTGGEYLHQLTEGEMPSHYHNALYADHDGNVTIGWGYGTGRGNSVNLYSLAKFDRTIDSPSKTGAVGGSTPHNIMQPYITVAFWRRIK